MLKFCIVIAVVSAMFNIIGFSIPYWSNERDFEIENEGCRVAYFGLWKACILRCGIGGLICLPYERVYVGSALWAVRVCEILGISLILGTILCFIMKQFVMKDKVMLSKIGAGLAIAAGIFMIIGCIVFAADDHFNLAGTRHLHAGFAFCIVSGILAFIVAVIGFLVVAYPINDNIS